MSCIRRFLTREYEYLLAVSNRYVGEQFGNDLLNDISLRMLAGDEKYEAMCEREEIMAYIVRAIYICRFSQNSSFQRKYQMKSFMVDRDIDAMQIPQQDPEPEGDHLEKQMDAALTILHNIDWFDREIFKSYYLHNHTLDTLKNETGIPRHTIYKSLKKAQAKIEEII